MKDDIAEVQEQVDRSKWKQKLESAEKRAREAEEQAANLSAQLEAALTVKSKAKDRKIKRGKGSKGDVSAVMVASDWHIEETIEPGMVSGLNAFNLDIATRRSERFFQKGLFLTDLVAKGLNLHHLVLAILGDIISGQLHEENLESNSLSPTNALVFAFDRLRAGIRLLLDEAPCKTIDIVCASGNHGRTIQKPRASTRTKHSFENLLYQLLAREFAGESRIRFIIEEGYHVWHEVSGRPVRFHHGDALRYQGGVGGLYIPVGKAIAAWNRAQAAYLDVFGHWHQILDGGNFLCNGSLVGYNAYAVSIKASYEKPMQQFFCLDKEKGKILTAPIFVED